MIYFLVTQKHGYTMRSFINFWAKELAHRIKVVSYEYLIHAKSLKYGTYIFSDIERLTPEQAKILTEIWEDLASVQKGVRLLNHPTLSFRRYGLLRTLHEKGFNNYNIYRLTECRIPKKFPVFLRSENDHKGPLTPLLKTPGALSSAIEEISRENSLEDKVMIEFCNTTDLNGIFRKYSAYIVGERIFPQHMMFGREWILKNVENLAKKKAELYEERHYLRNFPHKHQLKEVFQLAGINYGRIDYGLLDEKPQIWEINTNPALMNISSDVPKCSSTRTQFVQQMISALEAVDCEDDTKIKISIKAKIPKVKKTSSVFRTLLSFVIAFTQDRYYHVRQSRVPRAMGTIKYILFLLRKRKRFKLLRKPFVN